MSLRWWLVALGLGGCAAEPVTATFPPETPRLIFTPDEVVIPPIEVRDANGQAIIPVPTTVAMTAEPAGVVLLTDGRLQAINDGEAQLIVRDRGRELGRHTVHVRLIDRLELSCVRPHCSVPVGEQLTIHPRAISRGATVAMDAALHWSTRPAGLRMIEPGRFTATAPGLITVEAALGRVRATREVSVTGPLDRVRIECPSVLLTRSGAGGPLVCTLRQGAQTRLEAIASGGGQPIRDAAAVWRSSVENVATVEGGLVYANDVGRTQITAQIGEITSTIDVDVVEACRGAWASYEPPYPDRVIYCRGQRAPNCAARLYADGVPSDAALDSCCCTRTSPFDVNAYRRVDGYIYPHR